MLEKRFFLISSWDEKMPALRAYFLINRRQRIFIYPVATPFVLPLLYHLPFSPTPVVLARAHQRCPEGLTGVLGGSDLSELPKCFPWGRNAELCYSISLGHFLLTPLCPHLFFKLGLLKGWNILLLFCFILFCFTWDFGRFLFGDMWYHIFSKWTISILVKINLKNCGDFPSNCFALLCVRRGALPVENTHTLIDI